MYDNESYLKLIGIQTWKLRSRAPDQNKEVNLEKSNKADNTPITDLNWEELQARVRNCTACDLYKTRTQTVFGVGNTQADLLIVGEAPGANEDKQGEPFVGRAGRLLNSMLNAMGLSREKVYIANVVKSRPPNNRDPSPEEVASCLPYLQRQIALLQPKVILLLGRIAAHHMLNTDLPMSRLRGQNFFYGVNKIPLIVTYHPAYLLRAPREKRKAWMDLQQVIKLLEQNL